MEESSGEETPLDGDISEEAMPEETGDIPEGTQDITEEEMPQEEMPQESAEGENSSPEL